MDTESSNPETQHTPAPREWTQVRPNGGTRYAKSAINHLVEAMELWVKHCCGDGPGNLGDREEALEHAIGAFLEVAEFIDGPRLRGAAKALLESQP